MTSGSTFPQRVTKIDALTRPDHSYLSDGDHCFFLGEYTARKDYAFSITNKLILNFKKPVSTRNTAQWRYKELAILQAAAAFRSAIADEHLGKATFVPVPPSKAKDDPLYDDRMTRMLRAIRPLPPLDVRELLLQTGSTAAVHNQIVRPRPEDLITVYRIDPSLISPAPKVTFLCDDVLTTGCHYRAAHTVLQKAFPGVPLIGLFIARRVPEAVDIEDFDL